MLGHYAKSMLKNKRILTTDAKGNQRYIWTKETGDHCRFADVYDMLAGKIIGMPAASDDPDKKAPVDGLERQRYKEKGGRGERAFMGIENAPIEDDEPADGIEYSEPETGLKRTFGGR